MGGETAVCGHCHEEKLPLLPLFGHFSGVALTAVFGLLYFIVIC